jgi:dTDP-glucose 4,6-dehydratase
VLGGSGFIGSHLCERLLAEGVRVIAVDDLSTGRLENVAHLEHDPGFDLVQADAAGAWSAPRDTEGVLHLASPASPVDYLRLPLQTMRAGSAATLRAIEEAASSGARLVFASTSEVYGDPDVHPQPESYTGNVDPTGPRAVYDEAKRFGEAAVAWAARAGVVDGAIARIFNTVGPRMRPDDGRVVPAFTAQLIAGEPLTIHGDGLQTRSIADVDDTVDGLVRLLHHQTNGPINLGNPDEHTILDVARWVAQALGVRDPERRFVPAMQGDPAVRCPDITVARRVLGWSPTVPAHLAVRRAARWLADAREPVAS